MTIDTLRAHCLALPETTEGFPFGEQVLVFKVAGKMFALLALDEIPPRVNLKCDPERAVRLRERYEAVVPGYHMNKQTWNTVMLRSGLPSDLVRTFVDDSYRLVVAGLKKADRERIEAALAEH